METGIAFLINLTSPQEPADIAEQRFRWLIFQVSLRAPTMGKVVVDKLLLQLRLAICYLSAWMLQRV